MNKGQSQDLDPSNSIPEPCPLSSSTSWENARISSDSESLPEAHHPWLAASQWPPFSLRVTTETVTLTWQAWPSGWMVESPEEPVKPGPHISKLRDGMGKEQKRAWAEGEAGESSVLHALRGTSVSSIASMPFLL